MLRSVGRLMDLDAPVCDNQDAETTAIEVGECSGIPFEFALPARVVSAAPPQSREGVSVPENVWFKHWAKKSISSADLNSLSDHEERVWWRFLAVASSQEERWTVRLSVKLTLESLAYSCHSTNSKMKSALNRFEAMGMLTAIADGWVVTNWEKHQETPEARRQRLKRERDKERDMSRGSNGESNASLLRVEGQRTEDRSSEPKGSSESDADAPLPPAPKTRLTVGFKEQMREQFASQLEDFEETWAFHSDSKYLRGKNDHQGLMVKKLTAAAKRYREFKEQRNGHQLRANPQQNYRVAGTSTGPERVPDMVIGD